MKYYEYLELSCGGPQPAAQGITLVILQHHDVEGVV